jgi:hypothetical protein
MQLDPAIDLLLRCTFLALFAGSLAHKVMTFGSFRLTVAAYLRGPRWANDAVTFGAAIAVMLGETAVVIACIWPVGNAMRAGVTSGMLLLYAAAMGINLLRGNTLLDCGCNWGSLRQPVGYPLVWRNLLLALVASLMAIPVGERALGMLDAVTVIAGTVVAAIVYAGFNRLVTNPMQVSGANR